jgi:hypothetical protein
MKIVNASTALVYGFISIAFPYDVSILCEFNDNPKQNYSHGTYKIQ